MGACAHFRPTLFEGYTNYISHFSYINTSIYHMLITWWCLSPHFRLLHQHFHLHSRLRHHYRYRYHPDCVSSLGEILETAPEPENPHDKYAVKVLKENTIVGHVPRDISKYCTTLLLCGGKIRCEVTGRRQNKRGNGLEVPCKFIVKGPHYITCKIDMIIKDYISRTQ